MDNPDDNAPPLSRQRWPRAIARSRRRARHALVVVLLLLLWRGTVPVFFVTMVGAAGSRLVHVRRSVHAHPNGQGGERAANKAVGVVCGELASALLALAVSIWLAMTVVRVGARSVVAIAGLFVGIWLVCLMHNWAIELSKRAGVEPAGVASGIRIAAENMLDQVSEPVAKWNGYLLSGPTALSTAVLGPRGSDRAAPGLVWLALMACTSLVGALGADRPAWAALSAAPPVIRTPVLALRDVLTPGDPKRVTASSEQTTALTPGRDSSAPSAEDVCGRGSDERLEASLKNAGAPDRLAARVVWAWKHYGAEEIGCPDPTSAARSEDLFLVRFSDGDSSPTLVVGNPDGTAVVVLDWLVSAVEALVRDRKLVSVERRRTTRSGDVQALRLTGSRCRLVQRRSSDGAVVELPGAVVAVLAPLAAERRSLPYVTSVAEEGGSTTYQVAFEDVRIGWETIEYDRVLQRARRVAGARDRWAPPDPPCPDLASVLPPE